MTIAMSTAGAARPEEPETPALDRQEVMFRRYLHLVHDIAHRLAATNRWPIDSDDLTSLGNVALMDAISKYDPSKRASFLTYARHRIRGAILDHMRSRDWVPRSIRQKARKIEAATRKLEATLGRAPVQEEIAECLCLSLAEYHELAGELGTTLVSLEEIVARRGESSIEIDGLIEGSDGDPLQRSLSRERAMILSEALRSLPERERVATKLYYEHDLNMKEVAAVLGVTESRVSQLHASAIRRLRTYFKMRFDDTDEPVTPPREIRRRSSGAPAHGESASSRSALRASP